MPALNPALITSLFIPHSGAWVSTYFMIRQYRKDGNSWYRKLKKPRCSPPDWVFGPVWTALYTSMGYAAYLVYEECGGFTDKSMVPLSLYGAHLFMNWFSPHTVFTFHRLDLAQFYLIALDTTVATITTMFFIINSKTLYFMGPYLAWLSVATCLNYSLWRLNKDRKDL